MANSRYIQFVGRCLKLDKVNHPRLTDATIIHLDGLNYDSNWSFLLWSAFRGVDPKVIDLHGKATYKLLQEAPCEAEDDQEGEPTIEGHHDEGAGDLAADDEDNAHYGDDDEDDAMSGYKDVRIASQMVEDLRKYMRLHEDGDWQPSEPESSKKKRKTTEATDSARASSSSSLVLLPRRTQLTDEQHLVAIERWVNEHGGELPRSTIKNRTDDSEKEKLLGRWIENLKQSGKVAKLSESQMCRLKAIPRLAARLNKWGY
jgi:hypothetical protein